MTRFAPHAPTADRMRVTEAVHDEGIGMPQMALEEAGDEGGDDAAGRATANATGIARALAAP